MIRDILIHFLDHEVLALYALPTRYDASYLKQEFFNALKLGYLISDGQLLLPIASFFESAIARDVIHRCKELLITGDMQLISSELDYHEFIERKREQYKRAPRLHPSYFSPKSLRSLKTLRPSLRLRTRSSTSDITTGWRRSIEDGHGVWATIFDAVSRPDRFEREIYSLPDRLAGDAFVFPLVRRLLPVKVLDRGGKFRIQKLISEFYVRSYISEYAAYILTDFSFGELDCDVDQRARISLRLLRRQLMQFGIHDPIQNMHWRDLLSLKVDPGFVLLTEWIQRRLTGLEKPLSRRLILDRPRLKRQNVSLVDQVRYAAGEILNRLQATDSIERFGIGGGAMRRKAFIVHGHDEAAKLGLARHLEREFGFDSIIAHEQPNYGSQTIIEKVERLASQCDVAFVLLTPDDQIANPESDRSTLLRARQNVIFEMGYLIAKLGREKVILLHKGKVEIPSDIAGILYIPFETIESVHVQLKRELQAMKLI